MRNFIFTLKSLSVLALFLGIYLVACFAPAAFIIAANILFAPDSQWPILFAEWMGSVGVQAFDPMWIIVLGYVAAVFFPSIRIAQYIAFDVVDDKLMQLGEHS